MARTRYGFVLLLAVLQALPAGMAWADHHAKAAAMAPTDYAASELIPRQVLFGNPDRAGVQISPDGKKISYLSAVDGVLNVWVGPVDDPQAAKPVTHDEKRGVRIYFWAYTSTDVIYLQDKDGDENWRVYAVDLESGKERDLTPVDGVRANIDSVSHRHPNEILVGLNDRDPRFHDIYRINLKTGERTLVEENNGYLGYVSDDDYNLKLAVGMSRTGAMQMDRPGAEGWETFFEVGTEDNLSTAPIGFDKTGGTLYMRDSRERNTSALVGIDMATGEARVIAEDPRADVGRALIHPTENTVQAVRADYTRGDWRVLDPQVQGDFDALKAVQDGDFVITSRTLDDRVWMVAFSDDSGPTQYYRYDRGAKQAHYLFSNRKALDGVELAPMHPRVIKSRDGLDLVSYLTLPIGADADADGKPEQALPMVLFVHGGPWARDRWGYNSFHQWLANRGYAVLSVNYRGSTGFGKEFLNASNREWAGKMHDDLIDAVEWAIEEGVADPEKVAIAGGSYGGYATLVGLTFTPERFACGVDIVGPSNMITLLNNVPPYWRPMMPAMNQRVGDHKTVEGRRYLRSISPLTHVDEIVRPLLIGQGANDPRVNQVESDQIVEAMLAKDLPVTYVLYPDEGHGFRRPENSLSFTAVAEAFLSQHLGGRFEPIGDDFEGSSVQVPTGADHVPGVAEALIERPVEMPATKGP